NDIEKATDLARRMVTEFGMSDKLGPLSFGKRDELVFLGREIGEQRNYSDDVAMQIDEEVRAIIDRAYERATEVLTTYRDRLNNLAEKLIFGDTTTGASNDIEKATDLARRMVTEFGMSDKLGPLTFGKRDEMVFLGRSMGEQRDYSDEVAKIIDDEIRAIIDQAYERATEVLTTHRDKLTALAEKLVAEETVDSDQFEALFSDIPPKPDMHGIPTIVGPGQPVPEPNPQPA
ncbi:MAG: hypothetical protein ACJ77Y_10120, partial [Chloroflexota bacterium]